ncbi:MAG: helix-turn-helix domain-containing protein [Dactylosporangium sp.]|nr:helix-turn-helix domain-containing protein [Dactylosporangium sp.]
MIAVTTDSVPARERAEFWADLVSRHVTPIRIEPSGAHSVHGEIRAHAIGALGVAQVSGMGVLASHTRAHIARATDHVYAACVHVEGEARLIRRGETIALRPGDVFLTDSRHPFTFDLERRWRHLVVTMPVHWLDGRVARPEALAGAVLRGHPLAHLWACHLAAGVAVADQLSATAGAIFARQSVELLGELLDESHRPGPTPSEAARAAIFASACRIIALEFGNPDLTPAVIARAVGVSSRTLARVFAAHGETVMRRVFDERVRQAARLLAAPEAADRSISAIAFGCGFNDLSHFGRVFARRMHATPSEWRRRAL